MPGAGEKDRTLKITLVFDATPTNNVEIAFGAGAGDDPDTTTAVIGWDSGEWFVVGDRLRQRFVAQAPNPSATARRTLTLRVRLAPDGAPAGAAFTADGAPVSFQGLEPEALLQWLALDNWGALVVTSRGGAENASAEIRWFADGLVITVR